MEPNTTGKRVVSRRKFLSMKAGLYTLGASLWLMVVLCWGIAFSGLCAGAAPDWGKYVAATMVLGYVSKWAKASHKKAALLDTSYIVADPTDLPAEQSLVRASDKPMREQKAILLRAAQSQQTPPEQLVRPAGDTTL